MLTTLQSGSFLHVIVVGQSKRGREENTIYTTAQHTVHFQWLFAVVVVVFNSIYIVESERKREIDTKFGTDGFFFISIMYQSLLIRDFLIAKMKKRISITKSLLCTRQATFAAMKTVFRSRQRKRGNDNTYIYT